MRRTGYFGIILTMSILASVAVSCTGQKEIYRVEDGMVWNTSYHIVYKSEDVLTDSILKIFDEIDNSVSAFNENSTVSKINKNLSDSTDAHFRNVYSRSREISEATGGMFDPTLAPLIRAWGFGKGHEVNSDTLRIDSLLDLVGISKTTLKNNRLIKDNPNIEFNFSAIAKGYGVDCVADMFERNGVSDYLVEIGGEIRMAGKNDRNKVWAIGIDKPAITSSGAVEETVATLNITDAGVATSGNYRNYHVTDGGTFGHTISPVTGRPVQSDVISATVIAPTCMDADAIATSCMIVGRKKSLQLCDSLGYAVLLIDKDMKVFTNKIFRQLESTGKLGRLE